MRRSAGGTIRAPAQIRALSPPAAPCSDRQRVRWASRLSATAGGRYTHETKDIDNAGGLYGLEAPYKRNPVPVYGYSDSIANGAWTPKMASTWKLPAAGARLRVGDTGAQERRLQPIVDGAGPRLCSRVGMELRGRMEGYTHGRPLQIYGLSSFFMNYTNLQVQTPFVR